MLGEPYSGHAFSCCLTVSLRIQLLPVRDCLEHLIFGAEQPAGHTHYLASRAADGAIVLTGSWPGSGPKGEDGLTRMTYSPLPQGAVRQHGEFSADGGASWVTTFDFTYRPHQGGAQ